jgi:glycosyltransferase involved in cell wall biosynthesis
VLEAEARAADVILVQGPALTDFPALASAGKPIVADLYDPYVLENLDAHAGKQMQARLTIHSHDLATINDQAAQADFFLCASDRQRGYWLGLLTALNRVNPLTYEADPSLERLIAVVPFGLPDRPVARRRPALRGVVPGIGEDDLVLLWGGGIWNWFDPLSLLRAVDVVRRDHPQVRLVFMGTQHPNPAIPKMRKAADAVRLARELGLEGRHAFFLEGWVPYEERESYLAEADVGVSLHLANVETLLSFRTRVLDYLWAGLPMLVTAGDSMADLVASEGLGAIAPPEDIAAVVAGLRRLIKDRPFRERCAKASLKVSERFRWTVVAKPILDYCRSPWKAADAATRSSRRSTAARGAVAAKAWYALRDEGPSRLVQHGYRYVRKRLG